MFSTFMVCMPCNSAPGRCCSWGKAKLKYSNFLSHDLRSVTLSYDFRSVTTLSVILCKNKIIWCLQNLLIS